MIKKKKEVDITPYHVRQQLWYMSLLKFYKNIEYNENIYNEFDNKLLSGKLDQKTLKQLDNLRRQHNEKKKKEYEEIKKKKATRLGLSFRRVFRQIKKSKWLLHRKRKGNNII